MVRPIEITDALSKAQEVGRMQQNAEMRPEAAQEFQKSLNDKMHIQQTHSPNPVSDTDQVVLHVEEKEKEKRKTAEDQEHEPERQSREDKKDRPKGRGKENDNPSGHINVNA